MRVSRASWFRGVIEKIYGLVEIIAGRNTRTSYARRRKRAVVQRPLSFETCEDRRPLANDLLPTSPLQNPVVAACEQQGRSIFDYLVEAVSSQFTYQPVFFIPWYD